MTVPRFSSIAAPGIAGIADVLPATCCTVEELAERGELNSRPQALRELGFASCWRSDEPAVVLARRAIDQLLRESHVAPEDVDLLVNAPALPINTLAVPLPAVDTPTLGYFKYATARLQDELGLVRARTLGLAELSCISLAAAVRTAQMVLEQDGLDVAVCVTADVFPRGMKREVLYNVISDSACAVLVKRGEPRNRLIAFSQTTRGYYWDCDARRNELVAAYFPIAKRTIAATLDRAGLTLDDIALVVPHNVSLRSWEILSDLIHVPLDRIYTDNIRHKAHSIAADNFINLRDAVAAGRLRPGDLALLFCFGLGAHWGCGLVEV